MKKLLFMLAAGMMVFALIIGCSTEEPWNPNPARPLELSFVAGPADTVAFGATISFTWTSKGGSGDVSYEYKMGASGTYTAAPEGVSSVTYTNVSSGNTFYVRATDAGSNQLEIFRQFWVAAQGTDNDPPTVMITASPIADSYIATGSNISFSWQGSDAQDGDNVMYWYSWLGSVSDTGTATTVAIADIPAADPAVFTVWAMDHSGNVSTGATVSFIIKAASILYVDDYEWLDAFGNRDMPKEREQKQFYRDILDGYAFAEWDISLQGMPDSATLAPFTTVLFASDGDCADGTWWYDIGEAGGGSLRSFLESDAGHHLIAIGSEILPWIYNDVPPAPGDFEYDWLGINDQDVDVVDTTYWLEETDYSYAIEGYDSLTVDTVSFCWDYWDDFTWAINTGNFAGLPDSMKIDVAKNGDQNGIASNTVSLQAEAVVLYTWGLNVDGVRPYAYTYGQPVAHLFYVSGQARTAMLNFDGFSMPLPGMRQTIVAILMEFDE